MMIRDCNRNRLHTVLRVGRSEWFLSLRSCYCHVYRCCEWGLSRAIDIGRRRQDRASPCMKQPLTTHHETLPDLPCSNSILSHSLLLYIYLRPQKMLDRLTLLLRLLIAFYTALASAKAAQEPLVQDGYKVGQPIPVSCLNRTM